jgi:hypothetical protein
MSMLAELVELVIGVDTHADTHTAALVAVHTRALVATVTVTADADGYTQLLELAERHGGLRAWAIEGAGGYGAGLTRHLARSGEMIVELDRPVRPARRAGAKSDVIEAERAARDALARTLLAAPKTGRQRAALQALLAGRRSAVDAATTTLDDPLETRAKRLRPGLRRPPHRHQQVVPPTPVYTVKLALAQKRWSAWRVSFG